MAFTFKTGKMASNQLDTMLTNGVAESELKDGALVKLGDPIESFGYLESGDIDVKYPEYDTYAISHADSADKEICVVDYAGIQEIGDDNYKMGIKLYNLKVPAGYPTRVRRLAKHDKYWIGNENIENEVGNNKYLILGANGEHKAVASVTTEVFQAKIIAEKEFTVGMASKGKLYLVEVIAA